MFADKETLTYLETRLRRVRNKECNEAAVLVNRFISLMPVVDTPYNSHSLFSAVGELVSQSLDRDFYASEHTQLLQGIAFEMQGRTLMYRLAQGWLTRPANAPTAFSSIYDVLDTAQAKKTA